MSKGKAPSRGGHPHPSQGNVYRIDDPIPTAELMRAPPSEVKTRDWLTRVLVMFFLVALTIAGIVGALTCSATPISAVWAVVGPFLGGMIDYYYRHGKERRTG